MDQKVDALLRELKAGLEAVYGERLKGVYLYGSYARGEEDVGSDVDVLIVLAKPDGYGAEIDRTGRLVSGLSLKYGLSISRVIVPMDDWATRESLFLANAREEAIPA